MELRYLPVITSGDSSTQILSPFLSLSVGTSLARLPVDPMFGRVLMASAELGCSEEALAVIAMASTDPVFQFPRWVWVCCISRSGREVKGAGVWVQSCPVRPLLLSKTLDSAGCTHPLPPTTLPQPPFQGKAGGGGGRPRPLRLQGGRPSHRPGGLPALRGPAAQAGGRLVPGGLPERAVAGQGARHPRPASRPLSGPGPEAGLLRRRRHAAAPGPGHGPVFPRRAPAAGRWVGDWCWAGEWALLHGSQSSNSDQTTSAWNTEPPTDPCV